MSDEVMSLAGLQATSLPDNWTPLDVFAVFKCLDEDGETAICFRTSSGLRVWDCIGLLSIALDSQRDQAQSMFVSEVELDEDDEDDGE